MLTVLLIVLAVAGVWATSAVLIALVTGGVIHARDHQDAPYGGSRGRPAVRPLAFSHSSR